MPNPNHKPYHLNTLLSSLVRTKNPSSALLLFQKMRAIDFPLQSHSFPPLLSASSSISPFLGSQLHTLMAKAGFLSSPITSTALLNMYSNTNRIKDAIFMFDEMPTRDVVAWNTHISSLVMHGFAVDAIDAFRSMVVNGISFTGFTLCSVLKAFAALRDLRQGKQIHAWVIVSGYDSVVMATALIDFYSSCAQVGMGVQVFDGLKCVKDSAIWNSVGNACVKNRSFEKVFALLVEMKELNEGAFTNA